MKISFEKTSSSSVMVKADGNFLGWLTVSSHKPTGLCAKRYKLFSGTFNGKEVRGNTLTKCRNLIEGSI